MVHSVQFDINITPYGMDACVALIENLYSVKLLLPLPMPNMMMASIKYGTLTVISMLR